MIASYKTLSILALSKSKIQVIGIQYISEMDNDDTLLCVLLISGIEDQEIQAIGNHGLMT